MNHIRRYVSSLAVLAASMLVAALAALLNRVRSTRQSPRAA